MSRVNSSNVGTVELLRAIQQCDIMAVQEQLTYLTLEQIDAPFGPLQITAIELASSLPLEHSFPIVQKLISCGANVSSKDKLGRTPLHLACANGHFEIAKLLIDNGANIHSKFELNSGNNEERDDLGFYTMLPLPEPECFGRTPLHEAVRGNSNTIVKLLLERGALVDVEDEKGITPILLAGVNVQPDTLHMYEYIIYLLISYSANINNYNDYLGITPLHRAVCLNSIHATDMLLTVGAIVKDGAFGQTPIHEAASRGYTKILSLLLTYENLGVNRPDDEGRTALHRAAFAGCRECIKLLTDHGGDLSAKTKSNSSVFDIIFTHVPRPQHLFNDIFNSKITSKNVSVNDVNFTVEMDFRILSPKGADRQMSVIEAILSAGTDTQTLELLHHLLIETFLQLKWRKMRLFFLLWVLIHSIFVCALSFYALLIVHRSSWTVAFRNKYSPLTLEELSRSILRLSALALFMHSVIQCFLVSRHYIRQYEMWLNMICALLSLIIATVYHDLEAHFVDPEDWELHIISIVVLLAWIELMFLIGRFPSYGYYGLMFSAVLQNVLLTFVCLVVGFAISFAIQFHTDEQFSDPWRSIVKTTVMMMGEFEYSDLFKDKKDTMRLPGTSRIIFLMFIILSSIVLMNLMVGLSVNDIQALQKEVHAKRLAKQVTFLSHLEKILSHELWKIDVFFVLKPGKRGVKDMGRHNKAKHIPLSIIESIEDVVIGNANRASPMHQDDVNDKDILLNIMQTLNSLKADTDVHNIKLNKMLNIMQTLNSLKNDVQNVLKMKNNEH